jgi:hypothetical protein
VVLNRFDPNNDLHRRNLAWLRDIDRLTVTAGPTVESEILDLLGRSASS